MVAGEGEVPSVPVPEVEEEVTRLKVPLLPRKFRLKLRNHDLVSFVL